jgi:hypothetical protein
MALAVLIGSGALALGGWEFVRQHDDTSAPPPATHRVDAAAPLRRAVAVLTAPGSQWLPLAHSVGRLALVVDPLGHGVLVVRELGPAPAALAYQIWVVPHGGQPNPDARFTGGKRIVTLRQRLGHGALVAVTLERSTGVRAPTRPLRLAATAP